MTTIALVSIINHYHINGLYLFWDTLYLYGYFSCFFKTQMLIFYYITESLNLDALNFEVFLIKI